MKVVLTGGGTGGHIYPALSLWNYMQKHEVSAEALYIGGKRGLENELLVRTDIPFKTVHAAGLKRQVSLEALRTLVTTWRGYREAKRILRAYQPDVVVGTGGFVTLPVVFAAHSLGIPSVVWEGNAHPGLTNVLCARRAKAVALCFEESKRFFPKTARMVVTGNPRASEVIHVAREDVLATAAKHEIRPTDKLIVIYAGSRGSATVNEVVRRALPAFLQHPTWHVMFVTGRDHYESVLKSTGEVPKNVHIVPFVHDMPTLLPRADIVVSRAGSSTLAEICALGIASVLIPSPYVTANHQEENARGLEKAGAAKMIRESDLSPERLVLELRETLKVDVNTKMKDAAKKLGTPNAVENFYEVVMSALPRK